MDPRTYPAPGSMLGRFRVERRLGAGGMGVVVEATETGLDRRVAVKLIDPRLADDPGFRARFEAEARSMAALESPYVLGVHSFGEVDGRLYLATPLAAGGDLGRMLRSQGPPPRSLGVDLVRQVAAGLADAHAAGLLHRDVKPANVLLVRRAGRLTALLADFGVARPGGPDRPEDAGAGTPAYMAPELHGDAPATPATEVYAVGCLLWAVLTGRPPYAGADGRPVSAAHREAPVPRLPGPDPQARAVNEVLCRALAKDPAERYPSAAALRDALAAVPTGPARRPAGNAAGNTAAPTRRGRRRLPGAAGPLAVLASVLAAVLGAALVVTRTGGTAEEPLTRDRVEARAAGYAHRVPGFAEAPVRCRGGLDREPGSVQHCTVRLQGQTGWLRVRALADGTTTVEPELPPAVLERVVQQRYARAGDRVVARCPAYLPGRLGAGTSCATPVSPHGDRVRLEVTRVVDLLVVFDIEVPDGA